MLELKEISDIESIISGMRKLEEYRGEHSSELNPKRKSDCLRSYQHEVNRLHELIVETEYGYDIRGNLGIRIEEKITKELKLMKK